MDAGNMIVTDGRRHKLELFPCHAAGRHAKAQHAGFPAPLGVAAVFSGKALVGRFVQFTGVKGVGFFSEFFQILLPGLHIGCFHGSIPFPGPIMVYGVQNILIVLLEIRNKKQKVIAERQSYVVKCGVNAWGTHSLTK